GIAIPRRGRAQPGLLSKIALGNHHRGGVIENHACDSSVFYKKAGLYLSKRIWSHGNKHLGYGSETYRKCGKLARYPYYWRAHSQCGYFLAEHANGRSAKRRAWRNLYRRGERVERLSKPGGINARALSSVDGCTRAK